MKSHTALSALIALPALFLTLGASVAHAQDHGRPEQRQDNRQDNRQAERGAGPDHAFQRGDRLPESYRSSHYVVDDWRGHNLSAPPRGYHWVQTGPDYVLAAITTGVILQLVLAH